MEKLELLHKLNAYLIAEDPKLKAAAGSRPDTVEGQWQLFRALVNVRPPRPVGRGFIALQDELLQQVRAQKGVVELSALSQYEDGIYLWLGDITRLKVDAIVNAANGELLGCFVPGHHCIDNEIHTYAGVQLRLECNAIKQSIRRSAAVGEAYITRAYNLPSSFVLHTVGPCVGGLLTPQHCTALAQCYRSCLQLMLDHKLKTIAFCCISTGVFHFPKDKAAAIALHEVRAFRQVHPEITVLFNVFEAQDFEIYQALLDPGH